MNLPDFSKIGGFFEEHIEKIVLVVVGVLCAWLLITRVILSPNVVSYDGKNVSPTAIDDQIYAKAKLLQQKLNGPPENLPPYKPKADDYVALLDSAITAIDLTPRRLAPSEVAVNQGGLGGGGGGVYSLPRIGEVTDVDVEHIRTVGYVPTVPITPETPYDKGNNEPNDLDFVTVQAKFDVTGMFARFRENFVEDVEPEQADPCMAKPVFARVQLQRQEMAANGAWGSWQDVPRAKIEAYRTLFQVPENVQALPPGGLKVQLLQFDNKQVQMELLQPTAYQMASADEEWFPPELHRRYLDIQRRTNLEEERQAKEKERQDQSRNTTATDSRTSRRTTRTTRGGAGDVGGGYGGAGDTYGGDTRRGSSRRGAGTQGQYPGDTGRTTRGARGRGATDNTGLYDLGMDGLGLGTTDPKAALRKPSVNEVYIKFDEIRLNWLTDLAKLREPLVFWAHDDTVQPGKTYRYRIRLGVFNPVAGTNQLSEKDKALKDQVILWSDFSGVTKPVEIMEKLYFFANSIREMDKAVTVQVSRLALGRWYSHDFVVRQGEQIGNVVEPEPEKKPTRGSAAASAAAAYGALGGPGGAAVGGPMGLYPGAGPGYGVPQDKSEIPETVNCTTGAVMVDAVVVSDWSNAPALRARSYHDMLYSFDGVNIEHMPVGATYWQPHLQTVFSHIARKQREPREPFKSFGTSNRQQRMGDGMGEYYDMGGDVPYDMGGAGGMPLY